MFPPRRAWSQSLSGSVSARRVKKPRKIESKNFFLDMKLADVYFILLRYRIFECETVGFLKLQFWQVPTKWGHMKLSTRSRYGTRILVDLARNSNRGPVQIGEISKRQDISVKYLEQLIRPLKQALSLIHI